MKNLTRLFAIVLSVAMICSFATVSFADSISAINAMNYEVFSIPAKITQGTTEFTAGFGIKDKRGNTIDITADASKAFSNLYFSLADDALNAGIVPTGITTAVGTRDTELEFVDEYSFGTQVKFDVTNVSLTAETAIINVTFTIPADVAVGTYTVAPFGGYDMGDVQDAAGMSGALSWGALDLVTVEEAKQETTPEFDGATGNVTEDGKIGVEGTKGDGTKVTYDNAYSVSVSMKNGENADKVGVKFIPSYVLTTNGDNWASAAEAVFTPGLGKGDNGFTAALINIPAKFRETGVEIQARAFMVVGGEEKLDENIVKKTVKWDITADRD